MTPSLPRTRRQFLAEVGRGMLVASVGYEVAAGLGLGTIRAEDAPEALTFGPLEPLVVLMQETSPGRLISELIHRWRSGVPLAQLVTAGALANARSFGGEDYIGFHTMMALAPALHMAGELPASRQPLPVLKVLHRNTTRIQAHGGRPAEVLHPVKAAALPENRDGADWLRESVRRQDLGTAEAAFAGLSQQRSLEDAFNDLLVAVQDDTEVHRVVLPYRSWDLLGLIGREHAHALLRQSVHYCVKAESWARTHAGERSRALLPSCLEEHQLLDRTPGTRPGDDAWLETLSRTIFASTPEQAAHAAAAALAEGLAPESVGEAITLAANQLVLRDRGRTPREEQPGKPVGSVHGDSIGVHACDSANAWRNLARVAHPRNAFACLILGAYQVALDRTARGGDFLHWDPLPVAWHLDQIKDTDASVLLAQTEEAIHGNLQARAAAAVHRYAELGHPPEPVFELMLRYAVSEDGSLHAEKFYRTVTEEFSATRPAFRWRHLVALARVTASEYGRPAAGVAEAAELLQG